MLENQKKFLTNSKNSKILTEINNQLNNCDEFIISVAFITLGGVVCILESLRQLNIKGVKGKILTGCYLNFTEPEALEKLLQFENVELKVLDSENFHAKGFFFRRSNSWDVMIGSSNLTQSALTINNEWNLLFQTNSSDQVTQNALQEFNRLFNLAKDAKEILEDYKDIYQKLSNLTNLKPFKSEVTIVPNQVQLDALENLESLRKAGENKALIISATGTGKTFLSAFDVASVSPRRCLFIVHRTNIAVKAQETFSKVIKNKSLGLYTGNDKSKAEYLFATIQTLKNPSALVKFDKDEFDYIIIDEVHHADAISYKKVLEHFSPKFLLGLTATPERTDKADIFKLFDYNIAYEIRLHQALEEKFLCPFHYFAVEDFYLESEKILAKNFSKLVSDSRVNHIVEKINFYGYSGSKRAALMFVSSVNEAKELSIKLSEKGIAAKSLTSEDPEHIREHTIAELESGRLEIIVTVDIFNEGIDIPCINQVILLRPTQSAIVYIQQLGRGLRKHRCKKFVTVLDFIANYDNNFLIPVALSQDNSYDKDDLKKFVVSPNDYIAGSSTVTFTAVAKELIYRNIQQTNFSQIKNIKRDYKQLKKELGRIPLLQDFEKHNFISPEVILSVKDTYYDILRAFKENVPELDAREYNFLRFISKEFTPSKRLYEIAILEHLIRVKITDKSSLINGLSVLFQNFNLESFENAIKHLSLGIFKVNAGRQDYEPIIETDDKYIKLNIFELLESNALLSDLVNDLVEYNKLVYSSKYITNDGLRLYAKYTKKDIAHLLNQDYTNGGINLAGYRVFNNTALLFMTFDENKKFTSHDNKFVSSRHFTYYSKAGKTLNDVVENNLYQCNYCSYVFARIDKNDAYLYLGKIARCENAKEISSGKKFVKFNFELERELTPQVWQYFDVVNKNKN